ncbi:MAG: MerR family transcriptional regulator [Anaerolineae bacterium]
MYQTKDVCDIFGISRQTVRIWTAEFSEYLSPSATPEKGQQRNFSDADMAVFALVHEVKDRGGTYDNAHLQLKTGQRGELPQSRLSVQVESDTQLASLRGQITKLTSQLETALQERNELRLTAAQEKALRERADEQLVKAQQKIDDLNQEIGMLKARLSVTSHENGNK